MAHWQALHINPVFWLWNPFFFLWIDLSSSLISVLPNTPDFQGNAVFRWVVKLSLFSTGPVGSCSLKQLIQETRSLVLYQLTPSSIWTEKCVFNSFHGFDRSPAFSVFSALLFLYHSFLCPLTKLGVRACWYNLFLWSSMAKRFFQVSSLVMSKVAINTLINFFLHQIPYLKVCNEF